MRGNAIWSVTVYIHVIWQNFGKIVLLKDGIRFAGFIMCHKWCLLGQNMCQPKCGRGRGQIMHQRCQTQIKVWTIKEIHSRFVKKESNYSKRDIALKLSEYGEISC